MRILVTGGLGFIGSYLVPFLRNKKHEITVLDQRISQDCLRGDVTYYEDVLKAFHSDLFQVVIHMAGEVSRLHGEEQASKTLYVNTIGTLNIAHLCVQQQCKLINFSTSEVYGSLFDSVPCVKEEDVELKPTIFKSRNIYGLSKLVGEAIIKQLVDNYGLKALSVRPFMIYGPGGKPSVYRDAITQFVSSALKNEELKVHKGSERAWCYITDFVEAIELLLEYPFKSSYEAFNIGSEEYHSMVEIALMIVDECGKGKIVEVEPPPHFLSVTKRFSMEKIKRLGFKPKVSLKEGISNVIDFIYGEQQSLQIDKIRFH